MKAVALLLLCLVAASAQQPAKAVLIDQFSKVSCDDFFTRADNFFGEISKNQGARGYFVISGEHQLLRGKLSWEAEFDRVANERMRERARIDTIRGPEEEGFRMQFWLIPKGVATPDFKPTRWNFIVPAGTKAFLIAGGFGEVCFNPLMPSIVNEYLEANPGMGVHAVIYAKKANPRRQGLSEAQAALKAVDSRRVRYFFASPPKDYIGPIVEYWLVPRKRT